jgi:hypothetical protein
MNSNERKKPASLKDDVEAAVLGAAAVERAVVVEVTGVGAALTLAGVAGAAHWFCSGQTRQKGDRVPGKHEWLAGLLLIAGLLLLGEDPQKPPEYDQAQAIAQEVLEGTRTVLMKELAAKGAAGAIQACSAVALELAKKHEKEGWRIRRVSEKVRNPADTPDSYEARILKEFRTLKAEGRLDALTEHFAVVEENSRRYFRYLKRITIPGPLCLVCHGQAENLSAGVKSRLEELYPRDQATGYAVNDLRGAVSIKIPLPAAHGAIFSTILIRLPG